MPNTEVTLVFYTNDGAEPYNIVTLASFLRTQLIPQPRTLFACVDAESVKVFDFASGKLVHIVPNTKHITVLRFIDYDLLLLAIYDLGLHVYSISRRRFIAYKKLEYGVEEILVIGDNIIGVSDEKSHGFLFIWDYVEDMFGDRPINIYPRILRKFSQNTFVTCQEIPQAYEWNVDLDIVQRYLATNTRMQSIARLDSKRIMLASGNRVSFQDLETKLIDSHEMDMFVHFIVRIDDRHAMTFHTHNDIGKVVVWDTLTKEQHHLDLELDTEDVYYNRFVFSDFGEMICRGEHGYRVYDAVTGDLKREVEGNFPEGKTFDVHTVKKQF
jgi:hypothetical protein